MKKITLMLAIILTSLISFGQCVSECTTYEKVRNHNNSHYNIDNGCYEISGQTIVPRTNTNQVSVKGNGTIKLPHNIEVYTNGNIDGLVYGNNSDIIIRNSGQLDITLNNSHYSGNDITIYSDIAVNITYQVYTHFWFWSYWENRIITLNTNDSFIVGTNKVRVLPCGSGNPLPIKLYEFKFVGYDIVWKGHDVYRYELQGSKDATNYETIYTSYSDDKFTTNGEYKYYRLYMLGVDNDIMYSKVIMATNFKVSNRNPIHYYNMVGQEILNIADYQGMYIIQYDDMTSSKHYK